MTTTAWTFEVIGQDCLFQLHENQTIFTFMEANCNFWLDEARGDDAGIIAHMWKIRTPTSKFVGPFEYAATPSCGSTETRLKQLNIAPGDVWTCDYDFGDTTSFAVRVVKSETISVDTARLLPRTVNPEGTLSSEDTEVFTPPAGTPTLDELFPSASRFLFQNDGLTQWVLLFPMSGDCSLAIEAGPNAMGDLMFAPYPFESVEEMLLTLNAAATVDPPAHCRKDAFSRMLFPVNLPAKAEEKYQRFKKELEEFNCAVREAKRTGTQVPEKYTARMFGPKESVIRLTPAEFTTKQAELRSKSFDFDKTFPRAAAAHSASKNRRGPYVWLSYRRGLLQLCQSDRRSRSGERGVPASPSGVVLRLKREINSLQELFCAAELHWPEQHSKKRQRKT